MEDTGVYGPSRVSSHRARAGLSSCLPFWGPRVLNLVGQHRGQRRPKTGRGVCLDVTTREIPGVRARGRLRHVTQVIGPALRARVLLCAAPGPAAPQDRGARNPGQPVSAGCATPVPASRPLCSSLLGAGAALPATRCPESGPWRRGWGGGTRPCFRP